MGRLARLAEAVQAQESEGWTPERALPDPENWPEGEIIATATANHGSTLIYSLQIDPDGETWWHSFRRLCDTTDYYTPLKRGVAVPVAYAEQWLEEWWRERGCTEQRLAAILEGFLKWKADRLTWMEEDVHEYMDEGERYLEARAELGPDATADEVKALIREYQERAAREHQEAAKAAREQQARVPPPVGSSMSPRGRLKGRARAFGKRPALRGHIAPCRRQHAHRGQLFLSALILVGGSSQHARNVLVTRVT